MRTKALVLTAAISAASLVSALAADPVYSVNVVGYITKTVPQGFTMLCNPLKAGTNTVGALIPTAPAGTLVYKWTGTTYVSQFFDDADMAWLPDPTMPIAPGEGFWISVPVGSSTTVTFVGEVLQREESNGTIPAGFSMQGSRVPQAIPLNGDATVTPPIPPMPATAGDQVYVWSNAGNTYNSAFFDDADLAWIPDLTIQPGDGFWFRAAAPLAWTRNFIVQ